MNHCKSLSQKSATVHFLSSLIYVIQNRICLFCRFVFFFSTIFTYMEKGFKFWPIVCSHGHWTVSATPTVTRDTRLRLMSPRTRFTRTCCRASRSGAVTTCFIDLVISRLGRNSYFFNTNVYIKHSIIYAERFRLWLPRKNGCQIQITEKKYYSANPENGHLRSFN